MLLVILLLVVLLLVLARILPSLTHKTGEPPILPQTIPYVSHVLGILWNGTQYFAKRSTDFRLPIYTLQVLNGKIYAVTDVNLISIIQRNAKTFSFDPFFVLAARGLAGVSKEGVEIIEFGKSPEKDEKREPKVISDTHARFRGYLSPGPTLDAMNKEFLGNVSASLDAISSNCDTVELLNWIRHVVTIASTNAVYGPSNPFQSSHVEKAFWEYEKSLTVLLSGIKPEYLAPKAYEGREVLAENLGRYLKSGGYKQASALIQAGVDSNTRNGVSIEDQGRFEITTCIALLVNTVVTAFWTIAHVFSDPVLLQNIRQELICCLDTQDSNVELNLRKLRDNCPLLSATFKEVLRMRGSTLSPRIIMKDTMLDNQYLLKKDGVVQIPSILIHKDPEIWGANAGEFLPRRFLEGNSAAPQRKRLDVAFRGFGGGATLCPGRHFARMETMGMVAMLAMRFDLEPLGRAWALPTTTSNNMTTSVLTPDNDIQIRLRQREEFAGMGWSLSVKETM